MGISDLLSNAYAKVEDAYYGVLDFFEEKGIGLPWSYNDFLENKGIPALPFTLALIFLLFAGVGIVWAGAQPIDKDLTFNLKDGKGNPLQDVSVKIYDGEGNLLREATVSDGTTLTLRGIKPNTQLQIQASKDGYGSREINLDGNDNDISLSLEGENDVISGKIKLVDRESQTTITDAVLTLEWAGNTNTLVVSPGADGIAIFSDLPKDQELFLTVRADDYEDLSEAITFSNDDVKIKELVPKASASSGNSIFLVKAIDAQNKNVLQDVHIKIENARTGDIISDLDDADGLHSETLAKGMVVRVTISKEGYLTYSSNTAFPDGKTLRKEEENIIAEMDFGGTSLFVIAQGGSGGQALDSVSLTLLDALYEKIQSLTSNFSGETEFPGLNETQAYTLLAFHPNYFPARQTIDWASLPASEKGKTLLFPLTPITSGQSGVLTAFVIEANGKAGVGATVSITELTDGLEGELPLLAPQPTDIAGSFSVKLPVGMRLRIAADKGDLHAEQEITIVAGLNRVNLNLDGKETPLRINLRYRSGDPFIGSVVIESTSGTQLFSDAVVNGIVDVDPLANNTLNLTATPTNGTPIRKTINVEGRDSIDVILDETTSASSDAPEIKFLGVVDAQGNFVPGITPDSESFARFEVKWPTAASTAPARKGIVHVRVGSDATRSSDSQFLGIYGANAPNAVAEYGKSWNPTPAPGNEYKDRSTKGKAGSYNKWIELQLPNPSGTQIIDVRLKARVGIPLGTQELHYRAELQTSGSVARNPGDAILGNSPYTKEKSGLYAQTLSTTIPVYSAIPICKGSICARVSFIDNTAREYPIGNFTAMRSAPYALQVELLPSARKDATTSSAVGVAQESNPNLVPLTSVTNANPNIPTVATGTTAAPTVNTAALAQLRATTSPANPSLVFTKGELNTFGPLAKEGQQETTIAIPLTGFGNAQSLKARVHFVPQRNGEGSISLQITAGSEVWSEEIPISIVDPKTLSVEYAHNVNPGESITFTVNAETTSSPVVDALISLLDAQNKTIASVQGNNLANTGANGKYVLSKAIAPGLYAIKVAAPGFVPYEDTIAIGIKGAIELEETITLNIPAGQKSITQAVAVKNNSSFPLSNVTTELEAIGKFPSTLKVEAKTIEVIPPKGNATLTLTATYAGEASDATPLSGSMQLKLRAEANAQFPIYASSQLNVSYNRQLDSSCLQFDKQKLSVLVTEDEQPYPSNNYYSSTPGSADNSYDYYGNRYSTQNPAYNASGYNQYGYDPSGAYANPTQKRVGVKVKNNCGTDLDLITSINPSSGQQEVDGLKIAAVDSTLKLQNGQEKQVDFSVQNQLFRAGSAGLFQPGIPIMYGIQFRAPQLAAMLPLEINFFSRATALQTPQAITLNLIKSGNQKAVDRVPVNITNASPGPVFGISAQISDGYDASSLYQGGSEGLLPAAGYNQNFRGQVQPPLQGVTLRVENVVGNATLGPGQSLLPPIVVVGESTSDKVQSGLKTLTISGIVDGRRSILRQIPVYVQVGTSSCLKITATNTPVSFVSTETTGTQSQRVLIRNECLEPVRIGQISPSTAGANTLVLVALDGDNSLEKGQEKGFQFLLTKTTPYKGNFSVEVQGLLVLSQKIVKTEPIPLEVRLGANELSSANVSGLTQVPVCENPNERIGVRFPILATRDECSQAYCDAEQLANMLSRVVEQQIGKAAQLMQSKKNDAAQIPGCDLGKRSCSFAQMGIQGSVFEVFLQNDALSPQMMQYVMRGEKYPRLQGMQAELLPTLLGENADASFESKLGAGFGNKLFMPEIQGCGAYQLAIVGGVEMSGAQLQPEQINVGIKLIAPRRDTAECQYKIQNVANFLPKNRSLTNANNSQQTLFGNVESTPDLQASAETLAETVFGSKNRVSTNSGGSRLELRVGNQAESIVELTLDPATQGEGSKHVIGLVKRTQNTVQKEAVVEVGRIITQLGKGVNGCITRDERTWKIFSAPNIGTFQFAGCALNGTKEGGLAVRGSQACCVLNTKSEIQSNVSYALNPSGTNPIPGLTQLNLYEVATNTSDPKNPIPGNVLVNGAEYPLTFNAQTNGYQQSILLCGTADGQTQAQARNALVNATATRVNDGKVAGPLQLQVKVCTQAPADALAGAVKKGNGTYYTTANLEADPTKQQTIAQAIADISDGQKLPASYFSFQGNGVRANDNAVYQQQIKNQQGKALGFGFGACQAACMACHGGIGLVFGGGGFFAKSFSSLGQCAMGCGFGAVVGVAQVYKDDISQIPILGSIVDTIRSIFGGLTDGLAEAFDIEPENRPAFDAGVVGSSIGLLSGGGWKGLIIGGATTVAFAQVMEYVLSDEVQQKTDGYKESIKEGTVEARDASVKGLKNAVEWVKGVAGGNSATTTTSTPTTTPTTTPASNPTSTPSSPATGQVTLFALSPATGLATGDLLSILGSPEPATPRDVLHETSRVMENNLLQSVAEIFTVVPSSSQEIILSLSSNSRIQRIKDLVLRSRIQFQGYREFYQSIYGDFGSEAVGFRTDLATVESDLASFADTINPIQTDGEIPANLRTRLETIFGKSTNEMPWGRKLNEVITSRIVQVGDRALPRNNDAAIARIKEAAQAYVLETAGPNPYEAARATLQFVDATERAPITPDAASTPSNATTATNRLSDITSRYKVGEQIGTGQQSQGVFRLENRPDSVIKIIDNYSPGGIAEAEARALFARSQRLGSEAQFAHVQEIGIHNGRVAVVMELAPGAPLHRSGESLAVWQSRIRMLADAPQEHYDAYVRDVYAMEAAGLSPDVGTGSNVNYDSARGFTIYDPIVPSNAADASAISIERGLVSYRDYRSINGGPGFAAQMTAQDAINILRIQQKARLAGNPLFDRAAGGEFAPGEVSQIIREGAMTRIKQLLPGLDARDRRILMSDLETVTTPSPLSNTPGFGSDGYAERLTSSELRSQLVQARENTRNYRASLERMQAAVPDARIPPRIAELAIMEDSYTAILSRVPDELSPAMARTLVDESLGVVRESARNIAFDARDIMAERIIASSDAATALRVVDDFTPAVKLPDPVDAIARARARANEVLFVGVLDVSPDLTEAAAEVTTARAAVETATAEVAAAEARVRSEGVQTSGQDVSQLSPAARAALNDLGEARTDLTAAQQRLQDRLTAVETELVNRRILPSTDAIDAQFNAALGEFGEARELLGSSIADPNPLLTDAEADGLRTRISDLEVTLTQLRDTFGDAIPDASPENRAILERSQRQIDRAARLLSNADARLENPGTGSVVYAETQIGQARELVREITVSSQPLADQINSGRSIVVENFVAQIERIPNNLLDVTVSVEQGLDALARSTSAGAQLSQAEVAQMQAGIDTVISDIEVVRANYDYYAERSRDLPVATLEQVEVAAVRADELILELERAKAQLADGTPNGLVEAQNTLRRVSQEFPASYANSSVRTVLETTPIAAAIATADAAGDGVPLTATQERSPTLTAGAEAIADAGTGRIRPSDFQSAAEELAAGADSIVAGGDEGAREAYQRMLENVEADLGAAQAARETDLPPAEAARATAEVREAIEVARDSSATPARVAAEGREAAAAVDAAAEVVADDARTNAPAGSHNPDGSITRSNGITEYPAGHPEFEAGHRGARRYPNGVTEVRLADGRVETRLPGGEVVEGSVSQWYRNDEIDLSDGTQLDAEGRIVQEGTGVRRPAATPEPVVNPDGSTTYADGRIAYPEGHSAVSPGATGVEYPNGILVETTVAPDGSTRVETLLPDGRTVEAAVDTYDPLTGEVELSDGTIIGRNGQVIREGRAIRAGADPIPDAPSQAEFERVSARQSAQFQRDAARLQGEPARVSQRITQLEDSIPAIERAVSEAEGRVIRRLGNDRVQGANAQEYAQLVGELEFEQARLARARAELRELTGVRTQLQAQATAARERLVQYREMMRIETVLRQNAAARSTAAANNDLTRIAQLDAEVLTLNAQYEAARTRFTTANEAYLGPASRIRRLFGASGPTSPEAELARIRERYASPSTTPTNVVEPVSRRTLRERLASLNPFPRRNQSAQTLYANPIANEQLATLTAQRNQLQTALRAAEGRANQIRTLEQQIVQFDERLRNASITDADRVRITAERVQAQTEAAQLRAANPTLQAEIARLQQRVTANQALLDAQQSYNTRVQELSTAAARQQELPRERQSLLNTRRAIDEQLRTTTDPAQRTRLEAARTRTEQLLQSNAQETRELPERIRAAEERVRTTNAEVASRTSARDTVERPPAPTEVERAAARAEEVRREVAAERSETGRAAAEAETIRDTTGTTRTPAEAERLARLEERVARGESRIAELEAERAAAERVVAEGDAAARAAEGGARPPGDGGTTPAAGGGGDVPRAATSERAAATSGGGGAEKPGFFKRNSEFIKATAKGFVCDTAGAVAGYKVYAGLLKDEIENKVTIEPGSENVLDPNSGEIIFKDGQTYKITVTPDPSVKGGKKLTIDIVSPQEKIPANAWVDDCGQTPVALDRLTPTTPTPTNASDPAEAARVNELIQQAIREGNAAGVNAANSGEVTP